MTGVIGNNRAFVWPGTAEIISAYPVFSMTARVTCPRCGQEYLLRVELMALNRHAVLCPECDALWLNELDVGPPTEGSYGVTWFDYGTFMKESGRPAARQKDEVKVAGAAHTLTSGECSGDGD